MRMLPKEVTQAEPPEQLQWQPPAIINPGLAFYAEQCKKKLTNSTI